MAKTTIGWSDWSWNPMRGCRRKSEGCEHCYAESMAHRQNHPRGAYNGLTVLGTHGPRWNGRALFVPEKLGEPLTLAMPRRIFVASMSDPFYDGFTNEEIAAAWGVMALAHWHTFILVTKRIERAPEWLAWAARHASPVAHCIVQAVEHIPKGSVRHAATRFKWPLPNVQLFASAENQERLDERAPHLAKCDVAVRGLSVEPLLGPVDLRPYLPMLNGGVFVGGESGARKTIRQCRLSWIASVVEQCAKAGRPCYVKQLGSRALDDVSPDEPDVIRSERVRLHDFKGSEPSEWPAVLRVQQLFGVP